jgi:acyl-CoA thioesterase-2
MTHETLSRSLRIEDLLQLREGAERPFIGRDVSQPDQHYRRGLIAAQSAVAAGHTVDTSWRWIHSVHAMHLAAGDPALDVEYLVETLRDTGYVSTRLVSARQGPTTLAVTTVAFQTFRSGRPPVHQLDKPEDWPDPHTLAHAGPAVSVLEFRDLEPVHTATARSWVRCTQELPDLRQIHAAAVVLTADLLMARAQVPDTDSSALSAESVDLSVRFHRAFRADDWMRHECGVPVADEYRRYVTGTFSSPLGRLFATVSQEQLLLPIDPA